MCFKCGDKLSLDYKCAKKQLIILVVEELGEGDEEEFLMCRVEKIGEDEMVEVEGSRKELELSINAMTRDFNHNTIRIHGKIENKNISVLVDTGSSSSFIYSSLVKKLNLPRTLSNPIVITIAEGSSMVSKSMCKK